MIPIELATRIRDLVQTNVAAVAPVSAVAKDLPQTDLHEAFTAKIQQAMPDGTFKAIVAGRTLTLSLPHIAQEGDVLELVKTGHDARGTTLPRTAPSGTNELQPRPQLSQAGQLISQLITGSQSNSATNEKR